MRPNRTTVLLFVGLAASGVIFLLSQFALHYDDQQPMGKNFQVMLHDAYGSLAGSALRNTSDSGTGFRFNIGTDLLDFTNSSRNWHLPNHVKFADLTSDISLDHLIKVFRGEAPALNITEGADALDMTHSASNSTTLLQRAIAAAKSAAASMGMIDVPMPMRADARIEQPESSIERGNSPATATARPQHPAAPQDSMDPMDLYAKAKQMRSEVQARAHSGESSGAAQSATLRGAVVPTDADKATTSAASAVGEDVTAEGDRYSSIDSQMTCRKSFEPTCDMYPYVRFWNYRFFPEDCYESPLRPVLKDKTPYTEQKYLVFEPDFGGWNNIRMAAETAIIFAHATGRTLVMPPEMRFYLLDRNAEEDENQSTFDKFFDFSKVNEAMTILSMEQFLDNVARKGLLKLPFPAGVRSTQKTKIYNYMEKACHMKEWEPGYHFIGFNLSHKIEGKIGTFRQDKQHQPRFKEMVAHGRALIPYDASFHNETCVYFYGRYDTHRLLTHFYTYLYWEDDHDEQIYKRIVRDRLHYQDDIFCGAGRVVKLLHANEAEFNHRPLPSPEHASPKTLGGDTNVDATYFAYHIRRGDFQYKETRQSAVEIWDQTKHLLNSSISTLIYIATDERNRSFFRPFMQPPFRVKFLGDYEYALHRDGQTVNNNHLGMMEQVICANAHTFIGTARSTFTGYITRMRGYYRDGRFERTYYAQKQHMYDLQKHRPLVGPFWAREFEKAHRDIDDWWKDSQ